MRALWLNLARVSYLETVFSFRIPASVIFVFLLPSMMLLVLASRTDSKDFMIPGLIALITAFSAMQGVGQVAGSMRRGIWQTFQVSLHPPWIYLAGVLVSRIVRTLLVTTFLLLLAALVFEYWIEGSVWLHFTTVFFGSVVFACVGLFLGYLPKSPNSASQWINLTTFLLMIVSGIFFLPSGVLEQISFLSPLTYLTQLIRSNALGELVGITTVTVDFLILGGTATVCTLGALYFARTREDDLG